MSKTTFHKDLESIIASLNGKRPKLLLHACCGPCSSYCLEYLASYFDITVYYYNPNIYPPQEYSRRLEELKTLYTKFPPALEGGVKIVEAEYEPDQYFEAIGIKENPELSKEPEKGERCRRCYKFRLERAYNYAKANGFDYFCTTLSISPFKDAVKINAIGNELAGGEGAVALEGSVNQGDGSLWLPSDFKKNGGFVRSLEISEEYGLYRQDYCGCVYSYQSRQEWIAKQESNS